MRRMAVACCLLVSSAAHAIPAFARRYRTACTTCHVLPPQLNPFGRAFRANGYRLPWGEGARQDSDVQLGAPEWGGLWPEAFLPGTVPDVPPVAGFVAATVENDRTNQASTQDVEALLRLLSGGNLGNRFSWFASGNVDRAGAALSRAWLSWDRIAGPWLGVRAGQLEPAAVPFSRYTQRLSYQGYLAFEEPLGATGLEMGSSKPALEIFGAGSDPGPLRGLQYAVGLASRDVQGGVTGDGYARISYKFGGIAAAGDQSGKPGSVGPAVAALDERSLRVGAFVYRATLGGPRSRPRALRAGADAELLLGRFDLFAAGWGGFDNATSDAPDVSATSLLAGGGWRPWPWLMLLARYEDALVSGTPSRRRMVATVRAALQQNVAVSVDTGVQLPDASEVETAGTIFVAF